MKPNLFALFAFASFFCLKLMASPLEYVWLKEKSSLEFTSTTKRFDVKGQFTDWKVSATVLGPKLSDIKVEVSINTASVNTGDESRDKHLRKEDFFWTEKYAFANFVTTKISEKAKGIYQVDGELNLRGVQKPVHFDVTLEENAANQVGSFRIKGQLTLNRQDFGISYQPFFLLPKIRDPVTVSIDISAVSKATLIPVKNLPATQGNGK